TIAGLPSGSLPKCWSRREAGWRSCDPLPLAGVSRPARELAKPRHAVDHGNGLEPGLLRPTLDKRPNVRRLPRRLGDFVVVIQNDVTIRTAVGGEGVKGMLDRAAVGIQHEQADRLLAGAKPDLFD